MDTLAERLFAQYSDLKSRRGTFENQWQIIADYGLGRRDFVTNWIEAGRPRQTRIFDAIFQQSADELAAALQSLLVSGSALWHKLQPVDKRLLEIDEVFRYYEEITEINYSSFNDPESNFHSQLHETLLDIVSFGSGMLYTDDFNGKVGFSSRPLGECYVMENPQGLVDTVYRCFRDTVRNSFELFGEDAGAEVVHQYNNGEYNAEHDFLHVVMPREHVSPDIFSNQSLPWASYYLNVKERSVMSESGYHDNPFACGRWSKDSGEMYGRGPGYNAIADTKMINRMSRTMLVAAEKAADPVLLIANDGLLAPPRTEPGGQIVFKPVPGNQRPVDYLVNPQRTDITQERYAYIANQIRGHFHHELLQTFDDPRMSATQVLELAARTAKRIGPMVYRLQTELLKPCVDRVVGLNLRKRDFFPPPPDVLRGTDIQAVYVSPASIQQLNADVQGIQTLVGLGMDWSEIDRDIMDNFDLDKAIREVGESLGNAYKILRPERERDEIREAKNEYSEETDQMAQMAQLAQMGGGGLPAPTASGNTLPQ